MLISRITSQYIWAASMNLELADPRYRSNLCPECGVRLGFFDTGDHITLDTTNGTVESIVVLVGCEGAWVIPPASVGVGWLCPEWQDWGGMPVIKGRSDDPIVRGIVDKMYGDS